MKLIYDIRDLVPYINWAYFYFAWQVKDEVNQQRVRREAEDFLKAYDGKYQAYALFDIVDAHSDNDDIVIDSTGKRLPMLRQQQAESEFLCLADFLLPHQSSESLHPSSRIGLFATSVDKGMETDFDHDPYLKMMAQLLADRLAEAAAEARSGCVS